jgi:hypothetical protein
MSTESSKGAERRAVADGDRRSPHTYTGPDGVLMFGDQYGRDWRIYDRRSGERRGSRTFGQASGFYRAFVSPDGEEWRYELRAEEIIDETANTLERQLANAKHVGPTSES